MKRYFIEEAKCGLSDNGMVSSVISTVKYNDGAESKWISMVDFDSILSVYLFDKDVHDDLIDQDIEDEDFEDYMNAHAVRKFNGIDFTDGYEGTFSSIADDPENPAVPLIRYMIALERCEMDEIEGLIAMAKGHYADELEIPMSDVEEEYIEENGEEDE